MITDTITHRVLRDFGHLCNVDASGCQHITPSTTHCGVYGEILASDWTTAAQAVADSDLDSCELWAGMHGEDGAVVSEALAIRAARGCKVSGPISKAPYSVYHPFLN